MYWMSFSSYVIRYPLSHMIAILVVYNWYIAYGYGSSFTAMSINGSEVSRHHVDRLHLANLYNYLLTLIIEIPFMIV